MPSQTSFFSMQPIPAVERHASNASVIASCPDNAARTQKCFPSIGGPSEEPPCETTATQLSEKETKRSGASHLQKISGTNAVRAALRAASGVGSSFDALTTMVNLPFVQSATAPCESAEVPEPTSIRKIGSANINTVMGRIIAPLKKWRRRCALPTALAPYVGAFQSSVTLRPWASQYASTAETRHTDGQSDAMRNSAQPQDARIAHAARRADFLPLKVSRRSAQSCISWVRSGM